MQILTRDSDHLIYSSREKNGGSLSKTILLGLHTSVRAKRHRPMSLAGCKSVTDRRADGPRCRLQQSVLLTLLLTPEKIKKNQGTPVYITHVNYSNAICYKTRIRPHIQYDGESIYKCGSLITNF